MRGHQPRLLWACPAERSDNIMPTTKGKTNATSKSTTSGSSDEPVQDIFASEGGSDADSVLAEIRQDTLCTTILGVLKRGGYISFTSGAASGDTKISFGSGSLTGAKWCADGRQVEAVLLAIAKAVGVLRS